jgi:Zn-dependent M28 family amino/carboxypeptidase
MCGLAGGDPGIFRGRGDGSEWHGEAVRILLCAHWDTRFTADQDVRDQDQPIPGANDGGSGVGVLLEVARQLQIKSPEVGVDIVLFDVEDQGQPDGLPYKPDTYCLGSQYWAKNPHQANYKAKAGILLDMVGAPDAVFTLEGTSMNYAAEWMRKVWDYGIQLGHSRYFSYERTDAITDDHLYINRILHIPTIDIIHHDFTTPSGFGTYWHTHDDNLDAVDAATLQAVGETVLAAVYNFK